MDDLRSHTQYMIEALPVQPNKVIALAIAVVPSSPTIAAAAPIGRRLYWALFRSLEARDATRRVAFSAS